MVTYPTNLQYNAFISYNWNADGIFAEAVQKSLHQFAKPIWQLRALNVFRDKANQTIGQPLSPSIKDALAKSEYMILLASPLSANSQWVNEEVSFWCKNKLIYKLLIIQTEGEIIWDKEVNDFNWIKTNSLPKCLQNKFSEAPIWLDVRSIKSKNDFLLRNSEYKDFIGSVSATIRNISKIELVGMDISIYRKTKRLRRWAISIIVSLAILFTFVAIRAIKEKFQTLASQSAFLANKSIEALETGKTGLAFRLALAGLPKNYRMQGIINRPVIPQIETALFRTYNENHELLVLNGHTNNVSSVCFSKDGKQILTGSWDGTARLWDSETGELLRLLSGHEERVEMAKYSPDGHYIVTCSHDNTIRVWDVNSGNELFLFVHEGGCDFIGFAPDPQVLISANIGTISLWGMVVGYNLSTA